PIAMRHSVRGHSAATEDLFADFHHGLLGHRPRGAANVAYSPHLLSGLVRCECGARMVVQTCTRRKGEHVYRTTWYRCAFAANKGPAVCLPSTWYREDRLEAALLSKFREAMTPERLAQLVAAVNTWLASAWSARDTQLMQVKAELDRARAQVGRSMIASEAMP